MDEWTLFALNEADDEEDEKKDKDDDKKEDKKDKEEKDEKKELEKEDDPDDEEEYNNLMNDDDDDFEEPDSDDDSDSDELSDNDLIGDSTDDGIDTSSDDDSGDYNTLVVATTTGGDNGNTYELALKAAYSYTVIANNFKHIHLNAIGEKFEEIHRICEEYYHRFNYTADYLFELAAEQPIGIKIENPTRAKEHCDIDVESEENYDFRKAIETIIKNMDRAIEVIIKLRRSSDLRTDVQSRCDSELEYLKKQANFILARKLRTGSLGEPASTEDVELGESVDFNSLI